ncbi:MT-A70-domain-containing protein [Chaetomium tenue]|uniref:MT-A70-domain-containing protein n=1 Tax=Chaetomium tenue TaxID=1854479 RepID=A0ACB7P6A7_9PEZI|nr:MT-A70-domain-containing protein [Chaetomium globosum]
MAPSSSPSSILWQNDRKTVVLLDLPRSIEEAQVPSSQLTPGNGDPPIKLRRLVSALPPACPFPTPEPKKAGGSEPPTASPSAQVAELMTQAAVESALEEINTSYDGPWCLPRILTNPEVHQQPSPTSPRATLQVAAAATTNNNPPTTDYKPQDYHLPPSTYPLPTTIPPTPPSLSQPCPLTTTTPPNFFHLMLLDPPWPNRSAKRKRRGAGAYTPAADTAAVRALLHRVPVASRLKPGGLVGVWVTNKERFGALLTGAGGGGGVFAAWGVDVVGEWTWLKVTSRGEPVVSVESRWRRPWERLVIGWKRGGDGGSGNGSGTGPVEGKVIVAVPDVHSRKPNLRGLFEELLPERYEALEVFARNLTAGWWAWGDEVLLFQRKECWVEGGEEEAGDDTVVGEGNDKTDDGEADDEDAGT